MAIITIEQLHNILKPNVKLASLDVGSKTIGIAMSDLGHNIATPYYSLKRSKFKHDAIELQELFAKEQVFAIVVGLPLNMNGSLGPKVQSIKDFTTNLQEILEIPFIFQDERLSTVEATNSMIKQNISRKKRQERIDAVAAAFILQSTLDRLKQLKLDRE